jgi:putative transposase
MAVLSYREDAMPDYRRWYVPGGTYFFTVVTANRRPILCDQSARRCLHDAIETVRKRRPIGLAAIVLLPDHIHTIWTLPTGDAAYPMRWKRVKEEFTAVYLANGGVETPRSPSQLRQGERGVWQRRYWEHLVRDEDDLKRCVDYVHWNPKKHGHVTNVRDWQWSSFHRYVGLGEYADDWGAEDPTPGYDDPEWGE